MSRICKVCTHTDRQAIDACLIAATPLSKIAVKFRVSKDALFRHRHRHLPQSMLRSKKAEELVNADNLVASVKSLFADLQAIKQQAQDANHFRVALSAIRELTRLIKFYAEMQEQFDHEPEYDIVNSDQWISIRTMLIEALAPFPEAKQAVADAIFKAYPGANARA